MKITIFDRNSIGEDIDLSPICSQGECEIRPYTAQEDMIEHIRDTEVAIINKIKMNQEVLFHAPKLKLICIAATGYDNIDTAFCRERGIAVANVPGYSTDSVAMVTVSMVLSLLSHLSDYTDFVGCGDYTASGAPNRLTPVFHDLSGKTWGIVGYGNIGRKIGQIASAFGCRVIYHKNTLTDDAAYRPMDDLCRESDIITLHCPLTDATREMINERRLAMMKSNAVLVNTARGAVCDEAAVAEAMINQRIAGFGCDVYSVEPFGAEHPYQRIRALPNVILTPHMAWASFEARTKVIREIAENIRAFYAGERRCRVE